MSESSQVRWSTEGLTTEDVRRDGNTITVVCSSTHLTSFAVLVDVGGARVRIYIIIDSVQEKIQPC